MGEHTGRVRGGVGQKARNQPRAGKGNQRGEARMAEPVEVCILLGSYHSSWHLGQGCCAALCSFLGLVRNPWVIAAGIIAMLDCLRFNPSAASCQPASLPGASCSLHRPVYLFLICNPGLQG